MLRSLADRYGDREAQLRGDERLTFRELERRSAALARGLLAHGAGKGTKVALLMPNGPQFTLFFMAAARIGAIVAPLSTLYKARELAWVLGNCDAQILVMADRYLSHDYLARLEEAFPEIEGQAFGSLALTGAPYLRSVFVHGDCDPSWGAPALQTLTELAAAHPGMDDAFLEAVEANVVEADALCMIHTSGSTANPKGVLHGHGPMLRHTYQMATYYWGGSGDRVIGNRPHFWVAGLSATLFHCLHMGCCHITPDDLSGAELLRLIETEGATAICGDEAWFNALAADPAVQAAGYGFQRVVIDCASIFRHGPHGPKLLNPASLAQDPALGPVPVDRVARCYGMTETLGGHTTLPTGELAPADQARVCGRAVPGVELRVENPETGELAPPGEIGHLYVRGYCLMQGLYKKERAETFRSDGFYDTGDLVSVDAEGYLKFSSRTGDVIKVHGANVAPLEVELCLASLPGVARSAVVGLPRNEADSLLVAAVELNEGASFDEARLLAGLKSVLSSYKVPRRIVPLAPDAFPLTGSGKVKKADLVALLKARLEAEEAGR